VGVFNFDEAKSAATYVSWKDLGLPDSQRVHVFDFWNKEYLGAWEKGISVDLGPASSRVLTLLTEADHPQLISTSRHITQGWVDLVSQTYDRATNTYAGKSKIIGNDAYELRFVFPRGQNFMIKKAAARGSSGRLPVKITNHQGWSTIEFTSPQTGEVSWNASFAPADFYRFPVREPQNPWAEPVGIDGVKIHWTVQHQPAAGYEVWLDGELKGATTSQVFALRGLDPTVSHRAEVRTVWQDGIVSAKKAELKFSLKQLLPAEVFVSDLDPLRITHGWRQPEMDRNFNGGGLMIDGRHFAKGIGMPTNSEVEFDLNGVYGEFSATVGVDDEYKNPEGAVEFIVLGDGKELWRSGELKKADGVRQVKVDVRNIRQLVLRVKRAGEGGRIQADWVDAKLVK